MATKKAPNGTGILRYQRWNKIKPLVRKASLTTVAALLCLALAWSGLGLSCLPCLGLVQQQQQRRRSRRRPPKAAGCCCWTRPRQGRQDRPRPDQAKARHNKQASQGKAAVYQGPCGACFSQTTNFLGV